MEAMHMGILDKIFGRNKPDFSGVSGGASTAPSTPAGAPSWGKPRRTYTVAAGDSLSKIAQREYGAASKWRAIYEANRDQIKDPDLIYPGQVLTLP
jgi:nucleoid-associated protein YgaU